MKSQGGGRSVSQSGRVSSHRKGVVGGKIKQGHEKDQEQPNIEEKVVDLGVNGQTPMKSQEVRHHRGGVSRRGTVGLGGL